MTTSEEHTLQCDFMLVIGSSLVVHPAAQFPQLATTKSNPATLIILNAEPTPLDGLAELIIPDKLEHFLPQVLNEVKTLLTQPENDST